MDNEMRTESGIAKGKEQGLVEKVLTKEEQARLTPDAVIALLAEGNDRFVNGDLTYRNHTEQIRRAVAGQYPKAVVLSCLDSRIPVEDVFDRGIGDLFVARVAGNVINVDILGSMEFACKVSGAKLIVVMGHEHCGAVMGAIDGVELGHITALLEKIRPATLKSDGFNGDRTSSNADYVRFVAEQNVRLGVERVRAESTILSEMERAGEIKIVGAMYAMTTGKVTFRLP